MAQIVLSKGTEDPMSAKQNGHAPVHLQGWEKAVNATNRTSSIITTSSHKDSAKIVLIIPQNAC